MSAPILIVTGASGSGKTAAVRALETRNLPGVGCYYFDSIGVPEPEVMKRDFGSGEDWQAYATKQWLDRLATNTGDADVHVLDGQVRPSHVVEAAEQAGLSLVKIVLLDCTPEARYFRLVELRQQPSLANAQMDCWAAYLRGQADALKLPVIDTTTLEIDEVADALMAHVEAARKAV